MKPINALQPLENMDTLKTEKKVTQSWHKDPDWIAWEAQKKKDEEWRQQMRDWKPKIGDKCYITRYSDIDPATVIKRTPRYCWVQLDKAERDPDWKPDYIQGGFSVHCTNQRSQKWIIERNEQGPIEKFYMRMSDGVWIKSTPQGNSKDTTGSCRLKLGWKKYYDFNF